MFYGIHVPGLAPFLALFLATDDVDARQNEAAVNPPDLAVVVTLNLLAVLGLIAVALWV